MQARKMSAHPGRSAQEEVRATRPNATIQAVAVPDDNRPWARGWYTLLSTPDVLGRNGGRESGCAAVDRDIEEVVGRVYGEHAGDGGDQSKRECPHTGEATRRQDRAQAGLRHRDECPWAVR